MPAVPMTPSPSCQAKGDCASSTRSIKAVVRAGRRKIVRKMRWARRKTWTAGWLPVCLAALPVPGRVTERLTDIKSPCTRPKQRPHEEHTTSKPTPERDWLLDRPAA